MLCEFISTAYLLTVNKRYQELNTFFDLMGAILALPAGAVVTPGTPQEKENNT